MKKHKIEWKIQEDGTRIGEVEKTHTIKVSKKPAVWDFEDAVIVMKNVHDFLNYFFKETCKFDKLKVNSMLFSLARDIKELDFIAPSINEEKLKKLRKWQINLSYLEIAS